MKKAYWAQHRCDFNRHPKCTPLASLLETGDFSDFKLIVGPEKKVFNVHRAIISLNSGYFKAVCASKENDTHRLPDYDVKIVGYILNDLYEKQEFDCESWGAWPITEDILEAAQLFQYANIFDIPTLKGDALYDIKNMGGSFEDVEGPLRFIEAMKILFKTYQRGQADDPNNIDEIFWHYINELVHNKTMDSLIKNDEVRRVICENHDLSSRMIEHLLPQQYQVVINYTAPPQQPPLALAGSSESLRGNGAGQNILWRRYWSETNAYWRKKRKYR